MDIASTELTGMSSRADTIHSGTPQPQAEESRVLSQEMATQHNMTDQNAIAQHDIDKDTDTAEPSKPRRRSTSHLKAVPPTLAQREEIKAAAEKFLEHLDKSNAYSKNEMEQVSRDLMAQMNLPEKYLGFTMVMIGNFFWKRQLISIPYNKRLLLLPHCLKHAEGCPAEYDEFGLDCEKCGACSIADYKVRAEQLGYKVLVAEGSPIVLKIIVEGYVDGILGVACLNVLEKAIDKILMAGVPSYAIPLHSGDCKNTSLDEAWVWDVLEKYEPLPEPETHSFLPMMRAANQIFTEDFEQVLPRMRSKVDEKNPSPLAQTEAVSFDWLANGGKRFRPFITLSAYHALTTGTSTVSSTQAAAIPLGVRRVAMAIEAFHKASLVHDDIQDNDAFRYGRETLHRTLGNGQAINVGDHLIGLGYQLLNSARCDLPADIVADILGEMSKAHLRLCDGQGAEMTWNEEAALSIKPADVMTIYALKTSPAFEAALYAGIRMAGPIEPYAEMIPLFCRHLGIAFQILNDLKDWYGDDNNKMVSGQDAMALRPTLMLALAIQASTDDEILKVRELIRTRGENPKFLAQMKEFYTQTGVLEKARQLVDKTRARAESLADQVESESLRRLLYYLIDTVLTPEEGANGPAPIEPVMVNLPLH